MGASQPTSAPGFSRPSKRADRTSVGCRCPRRQTSGAAGTCGAWCQVQAQTPSPRGSNREVVPHHVERETAIPERQLTASGARPRGCCPDGDAGVRPADGRAGGPRRLLAVLLREKTCSCRCRRKPPAALLFLLRSCCRCGPPRPREGADGGGLVHSKTADSLRVPRWLVEDWLAPGEENSWRRATPGH